ncbi:hypothetical protein F4778DRAFT_519527 [Xylariomycetidae sp. FL2044]|nr:hypothetical protein F4778DRAFT_519527 [Xylariomycetidae sp. FL2044]
MAVAALGVVRTALSVLSFASNQFDKSEGPKTAFNFYIGSDGAKDPDDSSSKGLKNAGGNLPDIRIWEENGDFIKIETNDDNKCDDGSVVCKSELDDVEVQPTYTLFSANNDAMCISYATVNFPGDTSKYATTLGGWARACEKYEGRGGAWYWSDIYVQPKEGESFKTECAWLDGDGDQPTTGISLHWPEFDGKEGVPKDQSLEYFCKHDAVLQFHTEDEPKSCTFWTNKRSLFSRRPSEALATTPADAMAQRQRRQERRAESTTARHRHSLVKSRSPDHSADELCGSRISAGPSFVSYAEGKFCHMETKTVYDLCGGDPGVEEEEGLPCFDDEEHQLKNVGGNGKKRAPLLPDYENVISWTT